MVESTAKVRADWWQIIALMPIAMFLGGLLREIGLILIFFTLILYPIALRNDAKWISGTDSEWKPSANLYTIIGVLVIFSLGLLSFIVSPVYLYRRFKHLPK